MSDADVVVLDDVTVIELSVAGPQGAVQTATARGPSGQIVRLQAGTFVLACGGIENARLLLASARCAPQAAFGNGSGHVGRCFMEHPHYTSGVVVPPTRALQDDLAAWSVVLRDGHPVQRKFGLGERIRTDEGLLDVTWFLEPRPVTWMVPLNRSGEGEAAALAAARRLRQAPTAGRRALGEPRAFAADVLTASRVAPLMARYAVRQMVAIAGAQRGLGRGAPLVFTLEGMAEQEPATSSAVRLGAAVDRFGVPKAEVDWRITAADERSMRRSQELVGPRLAQLLGARVVDLLDPDEPVSVGWGAHHMGTTRMSHRPADGVVDVDCRLHGSPNVFVAGSSVFATGGSVNPTLTLVALAIRLADHLRRTPPP